MHTGNRRHMRHAGFRKLAVERIVKFCARTGQQGRHQNTCVTLIKLGNFFLQQAVEGKRKIRKRRPADWFDRHIPFCIQEQMHSLCSKGRDLFLMNHLRTAQRSVCRNPVTGCTGKQRFIAIELYLHRSGSAHIQQRRNLCPIGMFLSIIAQRYGDYLLYTHQRVQELIYLQLI